MDERPPDPERDLPDRDLPERDLLPMGEALRLVGRRLNASRSTLYAMGFAHALRARGRHTAEVRRSSGGRHPGRFMVPRSAVEGLVREVLDGRPPLPPA